MRKLTLKLAFLSILTLSLLSCKKDLDYSVLLNPSEIKMKFGQVSDITPIQNDALKAKSLNFQWSSDNPEVASVEPGRGGVGTVSAKRIGEATITYRSTDKKVEVSKTAKIIVEARNLLLNGFYFKINASENDISVGIPRGYKKDETASSATQLVFTSSDVQIPKLIYTMTNGKLSALYIILSNAEGATAVEAEKYLEERFENTKIQKDNILFYKNTAYNVATTFPLNSAAGIFENLNLGGQDYALGVKVIDGSGF